MEGLIFTIPILIVFLFFFIQIFLLFKKVFTYIFKNISELNQEITNNYDPAHSKDENNKRYLFKQTLEKPEEEYIPISERDINEIDKISNEKDIKEKKSAVSIQRKKQKSKNNIEKNGKKTVEKGSLFGTKFKNLNELEKAVIFKEVLDKPKTLRK